MTLGTKEAQTLDIDAAFDSYRRRFSERFDDRPEGTFVKFGHTLVQRLSRADFEQRLRHYALVRGRCKQMLETGATISDAVTLDFEEAAAWLALEAPNLLDLFSGELGELG